MPKLGADMTAGTLAAWHKHPGEVVKRGDAIAAVDTDKGVIDVEAFADGVIEKLLVQPGEKAPVGAVLALLRDGSAAAAPATPVASAPTVAAECAPPADRNARMRQAIGAAMALSKREIPHYYLSTTIDMQAATEWLARTNAARPIAERLLHGVLLLKATALALREIPELNAWWEVDRAVPRPGIHLGVAISLRDGGLVAPALHDVDRQSVDELMRNFRDLVARARTGSLRSSELADPTITVTSLGERGVECVFGIIYPPQVALVGFGGLVQRPWVVGEQVVARPLIAATLSGDHRASDGHRGSLLLAAIDRLLQEPAAL